MIKEHIKNMMLATGLYYPITGFYEENRKRKRELKEFYSQFIKSGDLVFDIGANVGLMSEVFYSLARKVVAVEPQPFCLRHLKSHFLFTRNVFIEPFAVDFKEGKAELNLSDSHTISSMSDKFISTVEPVFKNYKWTDKVEVRTITLDKLIATHGLPSFIKIDVEGYELNALKGLSQPVNTISFEFLPMAIEEIKLCVQQLNAIDPYYCINYTLGTKLDFILPKAVRCNEFVESILPRIAGEKSFGDIYAVLQ
jgi:FkbM family methyltransferase